MSDIEKVCKFLEESGTYYLATAEGDQPRVRPFGTVMVYEGKLYIQTGKVKNVSRQLTANPKAEICAFKDGKWLRVSGELINDDRLEVKRKYLATGSIVGDLDENTYPYMHQIFCAECGFPLYRRVYSNENRVSWGCSGRNRYSKEFCSGVNVPDCVIRDWGDIPGNIYISKEVDDLGKAKFKYNRESTWKKTHKQKTPQVRKPDINDENYPYKKYLHCAGCGSILTRHYQGTNKKVVWICSGYKHKGKVFCSGVRVPDEVVRKASEKITQDIYIRKENRDGETGYSYTSNWGQQNKKKDWCTSE